MSPNYEIGVKLDDWQNRIRFNAAAYYMEYDHMQIVVTRQLNELQTAAAISNAGQATMAGVEAELSFVPMKTGFSNSVATISMLSTTSSTILSAIRTVVCLCR